MSKILYFVYFGHFRLSYDKAYKSKAQIFLIDNTDLKTKIFPFNIVKIVYISKKTISCNRSSIYFVQLFSGHKPQRSQQVAIVRLDEINIT